MPSISITATLNMDFFFYGIHKNIAEKCTANDFFNAVTGMFLVRLMKYFPDFPYKRYHENFFKHLRSEKIGTFEHATTAV